MFRFAGHHGKPAGTERERRHALHLRFYAPLDDGELFLGGVVVPPDKTIWRGFQDDGGGAFGGIAGFDGGSEAFYVAISLELDLSQRTNDAVFSGLRWRKARNPEQQDCEPKWRQVLQFRT